jgi:beta-mannosidase
MSLSENELLLKGNPSQIVLEVKVHNSQIIVAENLFYFCEVKALQLEKPVIEKAIEKMGDNKYTITLKCNTLAKNVALSNASEGRFSNNYFDMLPGKTYQINFTGTADDLTKNLEIKTLHQTFAH